MTRMKSKSRRLEMKSQHSANASKTRNNYLTQKNLIFTQFSVFGNKKIQFLHKPSNPRLVQSQEIKTRSSSDPRTPPSTSEVSENGEEVEEGGNEGNEAGDLGGGNGGIRGRGALLAPPPPREEVEGSEEQHDEDPRRVPAPLGSFSCSSVVRPSSSAAAAGARIHGKRLLQLTTEYGLDLI